MYDERIRLTEQMLLEAKYARILTILSYQYFKGTSDEASLQEFMKKDYMQDETLANEFETRYLFHWVHAQFNELQGRPKEAIEHFAKAVHEWTINSQYIESNPRMYLGACFTYMKYIIQQSDPYFQILNLADFEKMLATLSTAKLAPDVSDQYKQLFLMGKVLALRKREKFEEITLLADEVSKTLSTSVQTTNFMQIVANYNLACSFFALGNYIKAQDLISELIHSEEIVLLNNPEYYSLVLILSLMNQYQIGNMKYLNVLRDQHKQELKAEGHFHHVEEVIFKLFSQLTDERYIKDHESVFERFLPRLQHALDSSQLSTHLDYHYIKQWISSKLY
jgi:tetratricopeptide (TPR) repeat protein